MYVKLTPGNFLKLYVTDPFSRDLTPTDQKIALIASVALGIALAGTYHLFVLTLEACTFVKPLYVNNMAKNTHQAAARVVLKDLIADVGLETPPPPPSSPSSPAIQPIKKPFEALSQKTIARFFEMASKKQFSKKERSFIRHVQESVLHSFPTYLEKAKDMHSELKNEGLFFAAKWDGRTVLVDRSEFEVAKIKFIRSHPTYMRMLFILSKPHCDKILKTLCCGKSKGSVKRKQEYCFFKLPDMSEDFLESSKTDFKAHLVSPYNSLKPEHKGYICFYKSLFFSECEKKMAYVEDFYKILRLLAEFDGKEPEMDLQEGVVKASYNLLSMAFYLTQLHFKFLIPFALTEDMQMAVAHFTASILLGEKNMGKLLLDKPLVFQVSDIIHEDFQTELMTRKEECYFNVKSDEKSKSRLARDFIFNFITYPDFDCEFTLFNQNIVVTKKNPFPFKELKRNLLNFVNHFPERAKAEHEALRKSDLMSSFNFKKEEFPFLLKTFFCSEMKMMQAHIEAVEVREEDLRGEGDDLPFINEFIQMKCLEIILLSLKGHAAIFKDKYSEQGLSRVQMQNLHCALIKENVFELKVNHYFFNMKSSDYIPDVNIEGSIHLHEPLNRLSKHTFNPFEKIFFSPLVDEEEFVFMLESLSGEKCENVKNFYLSSYLLNVKKIFEFYNAYSTSDESELDPDSLKEILTSLASISTQKIFLHESWERELEKVEKLLKERLLFILTLLGNQENFDSKVSNLIIEIDNKITKSYKL